MLLYLAGICWTIFYDTIYACQDKEDDALIGVKSTARLFGESTGKRLALFLIGASLLALLAAVLATSGVGPATLGLAVLGVWAFTWRLHWQLRRLDIHDGGLCLRLFRDNRNAGLLLAAGFAAAALV